MAMKETSSGIQIKNKNLNSIQLPKIENEILTIYKELAKEKEIRARIPILLKDIHLPDELKHISITRSANGLSIEIELPDVGFNQEKVELMVSTSTYKVITKDYTEDNHETFSKINLLWEAYYKILFPEKNFIFIEDENDGDYVHTHLLYTKHQETGYLILLDIWKHERSND